MSHKDSLIEPRRGPGQPHPSGHTSVEGRARPRTTAGHLLSASAGTALGHHPGSERGAAPCTPGTTTLLLLHGSQGQGFGPQLCHQTTDLPLRAGRRCPLLLPRKPFHTWTGLPSRGRCLYPLLGTGQPQSSWVRFPATWSLWVAQAGSLILSSRRSGPRADPCPTSAHTVVWW